MERTTSAQGQSFPLITDVSDVPSASNEFRAAEPSENGHFIMSLAGEGACASRDASKSILYLVVFLFSCDVIGDVNYPQTGRCWPSVSVLSDKSELK